MENFREIAEIFGDAGAIMQVKDATEFADRLARWAADPSGMSDTGLRAKDLLAAFRGATERNAAIVERELARRRRIGV
jgi:3-deoxy-D-manno-octulosonic-acid transferase